MTQEDLADRDRALYLRTTLMRLLELGAIPVLNENDSVSIAELVEHRRVQSGAAETAPAGFGDNDGLSARVAVSLDADLLVLLTNVGGLFTANPRVDRDRHAHPRAGGRRRRGAGARADGVSGGGTGGMASKLEAARLASAEGTAVLIAGGAETRIIERALAGEDVGTLITGGVAPPGALAPHRRLGARQRARWSSTTARCRRWCRSKASLLPIGVVGVEGTFDKGDVVEIRDGSGRVHGRGLVNYPAEACRKLAGPPQRGDRHHPRLARLRRRDHARQPGHGSGLTNR